VRGIIGDSLRNYRGQFLCWIFRRLIKEIKKKTTLSDETLTHSVTSVDGHSIITINNCMDFMDIPTKLLPCIIHESHFLMYMELLHQFLVPSGVKVQGCM